MLTIDRVSSIGAIRAMQSYTSVMYGVAPSAASVKAGAKASEEDARDTRAKMQIQQAQTADTTTNDTSQDTADQFTTVTRTLDDGTLLVEELQNGHIISSQQIKVAQYSQQDSGDTAMRAYAQAGGFTMYPGLLYDIQA